MNLENNVYATISGQYEFNHETFSFIAITKLQRYGIFGK